MLEKLIQHFPHDSFEITTEIPPKSVLEILRANAEVGTQWQLFKKARKRGLSLKSAFAEWEQDMEPIKRFRAAQETREKTFTGAITETGFTITRIIHGRNPFLATITGALQGTASGTIIKIHMKQDTSFTTLVTAWLLAMGAPVVATLILLFISLFMGEKIEELARGLIGVVLLAGVSGIVYGSLFIGFWHDVERLKPMLLEMFQGKLSKDSPGGSLGKYF